MDLFVTRIYSDYYPEIYKGGYEMGFLSKIFSKKDEMATTKEPKRTLVVDGKEIELDEEAVEFLDIYEQNIEAAKSGDGEAQMLVGKTLYKYAGSFWFAINRIEEAVEWLEKAAEKGYAPAYTYLGQYYSNDRYENVDYAKAFELFCKAAELGDAEGYCYIGMAYEEGQGVEKDIYESFKYYLKAADMGDGYSMEKVGIAYYEGNVVEEDKETAFKYLSDSYIYYDFHIGEFYYYLANCYLQGEGTEKQPEKAVEILRDACEDKSLVYSDAGDLLIYCYENGIGTPVDFEKANELRKKANETKEAWNELITALVQNK